MNDSLTARDHEFTDVVLLPDLHILPSVVATLTDLQVADIANGCGPAGQKFDFIPDRPLGIDFKWSCNRHDACYHFGRTERDKLIADLCFMWNLQVDIHMHRHAHPNLLTGMEHVAQERVGCDYFIAVSDGGDKAYWADKDKPASV